MEETKVPWWRKALNFALSGIRSGFGLFSKTHKDDAETEPDTVAGHDEIREEESKLTQHSPEQNYAVGATDPAEVHPSPEAGSSFPAVNAATAPEAEIKTDSTVEARAEYDPEVSPGVPVPNTDLLVGPEAEPELTVEDESATSAPALEQEAHPAEVEPTAPEASGMPSEAPVSAPSEPAEIETEHMIESHLELPTDETPAVSPASTEESIVGETLAMKPEDEEEPETMQTSLEAAVETVSEPTAEPETAEEVSAEIATLPESNVQPVPEPSLVTGEPETTQRDVGDAPEQSEETTAADPEQAPELKGVPATPPVDTAAIEEPEQESIYESVPVHEEEIESDIEESLDAATPIEAFAGPIEESTTDQEEQLDSVPADSIADSEAAEVVAQAVGIPEPTVQSAPADLPETVEVPLPEAKEGRSDSDSAPPHEAPDERPVQLTAESTEVLEEQSPVIENEPVDEVTPEPESAISEIAAPEPASPVQDEVAAPAVVPDGELIVEALEAQIIEIAPDTQDEDFNELDSEASQVVDPPEFDTAEPLAEQAAEENLQDQHSNPEMTTEQVATAEAPVAQEQTISESMELNQPNPEAIVTQEPATVSAPRIEAQAEPVAAAESPIEQQAAVAESGTEPEAETPLAVPEAAPAPHPSKPFIKREPRDGEANASPFSVIVSQVYDGPLDLLLDLIRKQDIDIYDIPIARITAQFLTYVDRLKATDVDVAGEFIYTASLLIHIKSKMLLPRAPSGPEETAEDPRRELVERLLEHERFKNAAQMLQQKQMLEAATWTNPGVREFKEDAGAEPEIAADTVDLVRVFRDILERARNRPVLNVQEDSVTVGQMIQFVSRRLTMEDKPIALRKLLSHTRSERALIAMFLALLELVRLQAILLRQDIAFSEIFIKKHTNFENVMTESTARDDWQ